MDVGNGTTIGSSIFDGICYNSRSFLFDLSSRGFFITDFTEQNPRRIVTEERNLYERIYEIESTPSYIRGYVSIDDMVRFYTFVRNRDVIYDIVSKNVKVSNMTVDEPVSLIKRFSRMNDENLTPWSTYTFVEAGLSIEDRIAEETSIDKYAMKSKIDADPDIACVILISYSLQVENFLLEFLER